MSAEVRFELEMVERELKHVIEIVAEEVADLKKQVRELKSSLEKMNAIQEEERRRRAEERSEYDPGWGG